MRGAVHQEPTVGEFAAVGVEHPDPEDVAAEEAAKNVPGNNPAVPGSLPTDA